MKLFLYTKILISDGYKIIFVHTKILIFHGYENVLLMMNVT